MKELIIVGGPNGAGKTTFAETYIAHHEFLYLSADAIAKELSPDNPTNAQVEAGREFLHRLQETIAAGINCVVESTLSGRTFQNAIKFARTGGYTVRILYLWLDVVETSLERVRERVQKGGHDVPEVDVRRRFSRCNSNFWNLYRPLADHWILMLNSGTLAQEIAVGTMTDVTISDTELFSIFQSMLEQEQ